MIGRSAMAHTFTAGAQYKKCSHRRRPHLHWAALIHAPLTHSDGHSYNSLHHAHAVQRKED